MLNAATNTRKNWQQCLQNTTPLQNKSLTSLFMSCIDMTSTCIIQQVTDGSVQNNCSKTYSLQTHATKRDKCPEIHLGTHESTVQAAVEASIYNTVKH